MSTKEERSIQIKMAMLFAVLSFFFIIVFSFYKRYHAVWSVTIVFVISLLFMSIDRISEITIGLKGIKAKMKEAIEEANVTIRELRSLAKIMASSTLGLVERTGRIGTYSFDEKEEIMKETLRILSELGISDKEQDEVLTRSKCHDFVKFDYVHYILGGSINVPDSLKGKIGAIRKKIVPNWSGLSNIPEPNNVRKIIKELGIYNSEVESLIQDYEYYIINKMHRNPEIWKERKNWKHLFKNK